MATQQDHVTGNHTSLHQTSKKTLLGSHRISVIRKQFTVILSQKKLSWEVSTLKLYEISDKYNQLISYMEETEQLEELKDTLDSIEDAFDSKVESIVKLIKAKTAERNAIDEEIQRLRARADRINKETEWLENYIQTEMEHTGKEKVKSTLFNISLGFNPPAVNVVNESAIPSWAFKEKVTRNLDKRVIMEKLKSGEQIPGVELIQRKRLKIS